MELKKAHDYLLMLKYFTEQEKEENWQEFILAIDTVLEELNNRISKDDLKKILRRTQDYQLNYKDTVLFNIIMQEIFGETEWKNLEDKE